MLQRLRRNTWNWLPAFLEVAETGSIASASKNLGLTPAAVSRTLRLLEDELGEQLFNRVGRSLALNTTGAILRDAVRSAQRVIDTGLSESLGDPFMGPLRVTSIGVLTDHYVVPCMTELKRSYPQLLPAHMNVGTTEANTMLARGQSDVAFYYQHVTVDRVVVDRIGQIGASVYCGDKHPLFGIKRVTRKKLLSHAFSVPQIGATGRVMDGWPPDLARTVGMRITMLRSNLHVCLSGLLLTVLPDVTAAPYVAAKQLRRFPVAELPDIEVFAARHESARERGPVQSLIDSVTTQLTR